MARRLKFNAAAFTEILTAPKTLALVKEKAEAISNACNQASSWGGYFSSASTAPDRARATVWSADNRNDEARDQRLVKNLDA